MAVALWDCQEVRRAHGSVANGHFRSCGFVLNLCCVHVVFCWVLLYECVFICSLCIFCILCMLMYTVVIVMGVQQGTDED